MTRPTGNRRGRPRKPRPPKPKVKKGRPRKTVKENPERYSFALLQYHIDHGRAFGLSERSVCNTFASMAHGLFVETLENSLALLSRMPFAVQFNETHLFQGSEGISWRGKNAIRVYADNTYWQFRKFRQNAASARWLDGMSRLWEICFCKGGESLIEAQDLAEALGERRFFEERMRPVLLDQDARLLRVRHFFETGDVSHWAHNRLDNWPSRCVRVSFGDKLLKKE